MTSGLQVDDSLQLDKANAQGSSTQKVEESSGIPSELEMTASGLAMIAEQFDVLQVRSGEQDEWRRKQFAVLESSLRKELRHLAMDEFRRRALSEALVRKFGMEKAIRILSTLFAALTNAICTKCRAIEERGTIYINFAQEFSDRIRALLLIANLRDRITGSK
jgi:hypothetical protein